MDMSCISFLLFEQNGYEFHKYDVTLRDYCFSLYETQGRFYKKNNHWRCFLGWKHEKHIKQGYRFWVSNTMQPISNFYLHLAYLRDNLCFIQNCIVPYSNYHSIRVYVPTKSVGIGKLILCDLHILRRRLIIAK